MNILKETPAKIYDYLDELLSGESWFEWEPETLLTTVITQDLNECDSGLCKDKILSVQAVALNTDLVCTYHKAFEKVVHAFCNNPCIMDVVQPPAIEEIYWSIPQIEYILRKVHGDTAELKFMGEIPNYVASVGKYFGWMVFPERLKFAQEMLDNLNGLQEWTSKHADIKAILDQAKQVAEQLEDISVDNTGIEELTDATPRNIMIKKLVGCKLYSPYLAASK
jgi:hypothetical protein